MTNRLPLALLLLAVPGCWLTSSEIDGKLLDDSGDTEDPGPITVTGVTLSYGTAAGGSEVVVAATPLSRSAVVRFGEAQATFVGVEEGLITVITPPGPVGPVDVTVESAGRTGVLEDGFEYWPDATGQYGTIGSISWYDYTTPLESIGYVDGGYGWMQFTEPQPHDYGAVYGPSLDTCTSEWSFPGPLTNVETGAPSVSYTRLGGPGFALSWSEAEGQYDGTLVAPSLPSVGNEYAPGEVYDLQPLATTPPYPSFGLVGALHTPTAFTVSSPTIQIGTPPINSNAFTVSWSTAEKGTFIVLRLFRWGDGGQDAVVKEEIRCLLNDDGTHVVPPVVWTGWESGYPLDIYVGRVQTTDVTLPHNAAYHGVASVYWIAGYGLQGLF